MAYPSKMPFYLYGTGKDVHIDHVLLNAPNAQLSAGEVTVELIEGCKSAFAAGLKDGLVAVADTLPERLMQPLTPDRLKHFFYPGATLDVSIYPEPKVADSQGPGLCAQLGEAIARATITLGANTFVDEYMINLDTPVALSQSPKKKLTIPKTTSISQDHPLFRGYTPSGPTDQHMLTATTKTQSWREVWDRALADRQFADIDPSGCSTASDSDSDDQSQPNVGLIKSNCVELFQIPTNHV
jgi:hypothetical protein